jgi:predicted transcriptional regulator
MTATSKSFRLIPAMDTRAGIMSDIAHEWTNVCGGAATSAEVARRWGLDRSSCEQVLDELVERGVLSRLTDGRYAYGGREWRGDDCRALGWGAFAWE